MSAPHAVEAVAVVVPARDEEERVEACLRSVRAALDRLSPSVTTMLTVVLDRCVDSTPHRVEALLAGWPGALALHVVETGGRRFDRGRPGPAHIVAGTGVGALRDLGVADALERLGPRPAGSVWLLHTDADTTVPPDWALAHLQLAAAGADGVAGTVELSGELSAWATLRHEQLVVAGTEGDRHRHVYGANLGVRADAYLAAGGFAPNGPGEDHALWDALGAAGRPLARPTDLRVHTSARLRGRARGGLADLLQDLSQNPPAG